jgi:hypothetical protein
LPESEGAPQAPLLTAELAEEGAEFAERLVALRDLCAFLCDLCG